MRGALWPLTAGFGDVYRLAALQALLPRLEQAGGPDLLADLAGWLHKTEV